MCFLFVCLFIYPKYKNALKNDGGQKEKYP